MEIIILSLCVFSAGEYTRGYRYDIILCDTACVQNSNSLSSVKQCAVKCYLCEHIRILYRFLFQFFYANNSRTYYVKRRLQIYEHKRIIQNYGVHIARIIIMRFFFILSKLFRKTDRNRFLRQCTREHALLIDDTYTRAATHRYNIYYIIRVAVKKKPHIIVCRTSGTFYSDRRRAAWWQRRRSDNSQNYILYSVEAIKIKTRFSLKSVGGGGGGDSASQFFIIYIYFFSPLQFAVGRPVIERFAQRFALTTVEL